MRDVGLIEGRSVQIEYRFAGTNLDSIKKHVAEVIRLAPDVIVANSTPVMAVLRPATSTIPIERILPSLHFITDNFLRFELAPSRCKGRIKIALGRANVNLKADLKGASEVPPVDSKGTGSVTATFDTASKKLSWKGSVTGLSALVPILGSSWFFIMKGEPAAHGVDDD